MKAPLQRVLYWTPRILALLFAAFISIFALDVFNEHLGLWDTLLALLIHLIPTFVLLLILAVSWRWEWVGGLLFSSLGVLYIVLFRGRFPWETYAIVSGSLFLIAGLFLVSWRQRIALRPNG